MGFGDWLMATSQVKNMYEQHRRPVCVMGFNGRAQWSEVFENNPKILRKPEAGCLFLKNAGGCRPYIQAKTPSKWIWKKWDIAPGEVFFSDAEREFAEAYRDKVLIEPRTKVMGNKDWFPDRWQALVDQTDIDYVQAGSPGIVPLKGVRYVPTTTFRQAMAILSVSRAFVGTEGALHHAAAALDVPAVVLWSHFIHPDFTGYDGQRNIRHADGWCGSRLACQECRESMKRISVAEVVENLREIA